VRRVERRQSAVATTNAVSFSAFQRFRFSDKEVGMIPLTALWLPILLSAVVVFFASFIMHMVLTYHKSDYRDPWARLLLSLLFVQGNEVGACDREI
jgi:H+/Cl- antiporter ClcA